MEGGRWKMIGSTSATPSPHDQQSRVFLPPTKLRPPSNFPRIFGDIVGAELTMAPGQWQCNVCLARLSRLEHLRRHLRSHDKKRPFECCFCRKFFTRKDVMKRHERGCKSKANFPVQQDCTGDETIPIESTGDFDELPVLPSSLDFTALDWLYTPHTPSSIEVAERLEYLAYFTSAKGMATFLDRKTLEQRQSLVLNHAVHAYAQAFGEKKCPPEPSYLDLLPDLGSSTDNFFKAIEFPRAASEESDPLLPINEEIVQILRSVISTKQNTHIIKIDWTPAVQETCSSFFAPQNIRRFLEYFWSLWYPSCPIVHRPLFDLDTAHPTLICVMVIIGACLSPRDNDGRNARMWMDSVEELVFSNAYHRENPGDSMESAIGEDPTNWTKERLECIQMTYLVCSLQKREGSTDAQARIRRHRHAMMVTLARMIGFESATHGGFNTNHSSDAWWREFIAQEELIRALTYVFLFDAALTIFHNSPPRMVVSELKMDLACPEACFQAGSAEECYALLTEWEGSMFWSERLSVSAMLRKICQRDLDDWQVHELASMGTLNLFTTVQSLHSLTFHLQNSLVFESSLQPVQTGLENWRRIWNKRQPEDKDVPNTPGEIWKKIGFVHYAPEFWHLARIIVSRIRSNTAVDEQYMVSSTETGLSRYDHTDMRGVNELIMEYQRFNLGGAKIAT
ncbi:transcription factor domain-containing protein [Aspergillus affinis]|uniref:transcription factor domain-containing protein n=1 Tax=Aspergillus affinis TaxID=1070780 RepID=UPI0022FE51BA|nr:uncharacterized protein KD926_001724 [Aspergillus affinis]KAI9036513.1 hypothetical protein KD926_001724 [Aspergillus affinis]